MIRGCVAACASVALACLLGAPVPAAAATPPLDPAATVAKGKQALGRTLGNYTLADKTGAPLALRDYRGKPLVVSLHAFELAVEYFDRVIGLRAGNIVFDRSADDLRRSGSAALATSLYDLSAAEDS